LPLQYRDAGRIGQGVRSHGAITWSR
jgi:hypothetical protein